MSSQVKLLITNNSFCIVQRATAHLKTGIFRDMEFIIPLDQDIQNISKPSQQLPVAEKPPPLHRVASSPPFEYTGGTSCFHEMSHPLALINIEEVEASTKATREALGNHRKLRWIEVVLHEHFSQSDREKLIDQNQSALTNASIRREVRVVVYGIIHLTWQYSVFILIYRDLTRFSFIALVYSRTMTDCSSNETFETFVDVTQEADHTLLLGSGVKGTFSAKVVAGPTQLAGIQPALTPADSEALDALVKAFPAFREACGIRGIDPDEVRRTTGKCFVVSSTRISLL
jgi:hypothetical protein